MKRLAPFFLLWAACTTPGTTPGASQPQDEFVPTCPTGFPGRGVWSLGKARFRADFCSALGGRGTTDFRIVRLTVRDDDARLAPEARQPVVLEGQALQERFRYRYNHLNACDSFALTLPGVVYAATGPANAGCGPAEAPAPERTFADQNPATLAVVRYGEGSWQNLELPCGHWLFQCGD